MLAPLDNVLDSGPRSGKSRGVRMCAVSREVRPIEELIRFVISPTGEVVPDLKRKLPGRGLWISASRQAVAEAVRRHQFNKGFKRDVRVAPTLSADVEALLARSAVEALAIAAKAGQVIAGFGKVASILEQHQRDRQIEALLHASDGAPDGVRKLDALARQNAGQFGKRAEIPTVIVFTSAELDLALGRSNVIHAALLAGPASKTFMSRSQILVQYRMADGGKIAGTAAGNS